MVIDINTDGLDTDENLSQLAKSCANILEQTNFKTEIALARNFVYQVLREDYPREITQALTADNVFLVCLPAGRPTPLVSMASY